ncbi:hypothetical protein WQ54_22995 [Bacillus sp. SA1-12]|uniref:hypothetical protein n=1 Tax=Bacillus sp. SA1-12 TaxID=1455638 RepID=UPI000626EE8D|nr:hypothetical protein [Bacillus sp. SA1-12]KKI90002.1 hypothetical protein WQ54_22995 [Bacillus sp. SA1-12]
MNRHNIKQYLFTFGTLTFLFMSIYSFYDVDWRNETLNNAKSFIAPLGMLMIMQILGGLIQP